MIGDQHPPPPKSDLTAVEADRVLSEMRYLEALVAYARGSGSPPCNDCKRLCSGDDHLTEVNPPGGYGRSQVLVCDECMGSPRWAHWRAEHWPNWPEPRTPSQS